MSEHRQAGKSVMIKRRRKRKLWAEKREPDDLPEPLPPLDDPSYPFLNLADENPGGGGRIWLYPYSEAEPSLDRWIIAYVATAPSRRATITSCAIFSTA
jgi:hypothetical protein